MPAAACVSSCSASFTSVMAGAAPMAASPASVARTAVQAPSGRRQPRPMYFIDASHSST
jgi:hypothetical protein